MLYTNTQSSSHIIPQYIGAEVRIDSKLIKQVLWLEITQQFSDHNYLTLKIRHEEIQKHGVLFFDGAEELLGKYTEVIIYDKNNRDHVNQFEGKFYVTDVQFAHDSLNEGHLVLKGCSPTWALDGAPSYESFNNETLASVARCVAKPLEEVRSDIITNPSFTEPVKYVCRFNESAWNFMRRLAADTSQFLYFDGHNLIFGKPNNKKGPDLFYGQNCYRLSMNMRMRPVQTGLYDYESHLNDTFTYGTAEPKGFEGSYRGFAFLRAQQMIPFVRNYTHPNILPAADYQLMDMAKLFTNGTGAGMYEINGESSHFQLHVGMVVTLRGKRLGREQRHTDIRISSVKHTLDASGKYYNEFTAILESCEAPPPFVCQRPQTYPLPATVLSNDDPLGKGRVKVKFINWRMEYGQETDWIRVLTPHAGGGGSNDLANNRGMVWIPEKNDQVIVDFEQGNPDRPIVVGSVFHGKNGQGGQSDNHIKSITTRSGHTIEFNDNANGTHILIKDPVGNTVHMDTKGKNMNITSPETLTLNCKNMRINVGENMMTQVGNDNTMQVSNNMLVSVANRLSTFSQSTFINSVKVLDLFGGKQIIGFADRVDMGAKANLHMHGKEALITAEDKLEHKAPKIDKTPAPDRFQYTQEPEVVNIYWLDGEAKREITSTPLDTHVSIFAETRNMKAGEALTIEINELEKDGDAGKKMVEELTGTVDENGIAKLVARYKIVEQKNK